MAAGGSAAVTDLGVAPAIRIAEARGATSSTGVAMGTPGFTAPELAMADPHCDHRADIYAFGAGSDLDAANINLSGLDDSNDFSSPDGLAFSRASVGLADPLLWIQTDDSAFTDQTNNQMLLAIPGNVGDGGARTVNNTTAAGVAAPQATRVGAAPTAATLKRFLVGPVECELTGIDSTPDGRTIFAGIQHPGELGSPAAPTSHWPDSQATGTAGATIRPRSAVVVITKDDGGVVGL